MRIEQIKAFLAVNDTGSFGQAAKQCGVTQSTVSRQVQALEAHLGTSLFHRHAQAKLTVGGERLLPHARRICQEWEKVEEKMKELLQGEQPELCVAAIHSVCAYFLPPILQSFCRSFPQVQLRVTALGSDRALKVLRDGLVDVAIVMNNKYLTATGEMYVKPLYEEVIQVLVSKDHPLASFETTTIKDLVGFPQVIFKDGYGMQRIVQDLFTSHGFDLPVAMELNTLDAFRGVIRQGNLIALLPQSALQEAVLDPTLAVVSIALDSGLPLTRDVVLVTTRDRLEIPTVKNFFNLVYNQTQS
ncbi:transcriptional regulator, LysR family [Cyanobacterium stanieri PCC 7202]|uniref:Transcriptional regulator, LysR family n=1 Tax=Cyanobacterium stanieri (strain ATCC 29140 / PCC 7202) TaxID=292563 RepID=K9YHW5_CYASC|nr:transcriptional regulator, LysR family [Cyanobacterium stanieri PCC 7202]